jgi:hypothetical protein
MYMTRPGAQLFVHTFEGKGWTDRQTDRQTDRKNRANKSFPNFFDNMERHLQRARVDLEELFSNQA